jgi:hypothetical protein
MDAALVGHWSSAQERGSAELEVTGQGEEGHVRITLTESGKSPETDEARLITARLERQTFASLWGGEDGQQTWTLVRYELHPPDRLSIYLHNNRFWKDAIRNKLVAGEIDTRGMIEGVRVKASSEELRKLILGYGGVIFEDNAVLEFTRGSPD